MVKNNYNCRINAKAIVRVSNSIVTVILKKPAIVHDFAKVKYEKKQMYYGYKCLQKYILKDCDYPIYNDKINVTDLFQKHYKNITISIDIFSKM